MSTDEIKQLVKKKMPISEESVDFVEEKHDRSE
jgi:hypothetical protein